MKTYPSIGVQIPQVLLPRQGISLAQWSVISCDQFTSQPEYWQQVEKYVNNVPSTFHLTLPEIYLEQPGLEARIQRIHANMRQYLESAIFEPYEGLVYVERTTGGQYLTAIRRSNGYKIGRSRGNGKNSIGNINRIIIDFADPDQTFYPAPPTQKHHHFLLKQ